MNFTRYVPDIVRRFTRRIILKSYLFGLGASVVIGGSYLAFAQGGSQTQAASQSLAQVERRTIVSSVKATGKVTFANEQQLRFNQRGKVANVYVKEGDRVTKGQMIAQLDTSTVMADIRQAQLSLNASALQLQQLQGNTQKFVLDAENTLRESERQFNDAQNALIVAREKLPTDIAGAERAVKEREAAVEQAKAALEQAKITTLQDLGTTAQSILAKSEDLLDTLHGVLVNDSSARRTNYGGSFLEIYHRLYIDYGLKFETERSYHAALQAVEGMRAKYGSSLPTLREPDALAAAVSDARETARAIHTLSDTMYRLVQGATDDPHDFTVAKINAIKQSIMSARTSAASLMTQAETAQASLMGGKNGMTSITIQQKEDALKTTENALLAAQENLRILKTQTPVDLTKQESTLAKIQDDYRSKQLALDQVTRNSHVDVKLKQNDISQKATSLQRTQKALEDYQLKAPFDGVIRRLDYQVGDNLLDTGESKFVVLENPDFLIVTILLDQVDVIRVRKDMTATIVFDALPERRFQGIIDEINSTPVENSGVVSYQVSIRLETPEDLTILSGMTATVEVETTRKESVLVVPNLALQRTNGQASVRTADGRTVHVTVGMTDGRYTEIISSLQEGDRILSMNVSIQQTGQNNNANPAQLFRLGGGGGGFTPGGGGRGGGNFLR